MRVDHVDMLAPLPPARGRRPRRSRAVGGVDDEDRRAAHAFITPASGCQAARR